MPRIHRTAAAALAAAFVLTGIALDQAVAAPTELANVPIAGVGQSTPKPNIMLLMDTSRSMGFTHMPDELEPPSQYTLSVGYRSAQCNSLYYDPGKLYQLPKDASGAFLPMPAFAGARYDTYSATNTTTVDLGAKFRAYDRNTRQLSVANSAEDAEQPAYYYQFVNGSNASPALAYSAAPCTDQEAVLFPAGGTPTSLMTATSSGGQWRRKQVTAASGTGPAGADERQNFAIWYTYYRTRMAMVKSSVSLAFNPLTERFRVGVVSMNPLNDSTNAESGVAASKYLAIQDFDTVQRGLWFKKVFEQQPDGSSPAREGLARVGRHYAGRFDGINQGMTPDPVKNSCQQNFTIMTTDGYWNTAAETRGPVGLDGVTLVGQQDGNLTPKSSLDRNNPNQYSHRPIWDGSTSGSRTDVNRLEQSRYTPCDTNEYYRTTSVMRSSTTKVVQRSQSLSFTLSQTYMSTAQSRMSTSRPTQTTTTETQQTRQRLSSTQYQTQSTRQDFKTTTWFGQGTRTIYEKTSQNLQTTSSYALMTQVRRDQRTVQMFQSQRTPTASTTQTLRSTSQQLASTSQLRRTDTTVMRSTTQPVRSTSVLQVSTRREAERTQQWLEYNGRTERTLPVASCTNGGDITCISLVTGPTPVAACSPQTAAAGNDYVTRTCDAPTLNGPTPTGSCAQSSASSSNGYVWTTCNTATTGPAPAASCSPQTGNGSNGYLTVTCSTSTTPPTLVGSCTGGTDSSTFITTTCTPSSTSTPVASCSSAAASAPNYITSTCGTATTTDVPVASCSASGASSNNNYTATTCRTVTTGPTAAASCGTAAADGSNGYTATSCTPVNNNNVPVASCTASGPTANNGYTTTTCGSTPVSGPTLVASCAAQPASGTNGFVETTCNPTTSAWTPNGSCAASGPTTQNGLTATECTNVTTVNSQAVPLASCTNQTVGAVTTSCVIVPQSTVAVSSCTPNSTGPGVITCSQPTNEVAVPQCTPVTASAQNSWVTKTCRTVDGPPTNVQACSNNAGTYCTLNTQKVAVAPNTCQSQNPNNGNGYTTIACTSETTGPTNVSFGSCNQVTATSASSWKATTCNIVGPTTPTPVQSCNNNNGTTGTFVKTVCTDNNSAVQRVDPGSCTNRNATNGNDWTSTVCTPSSNTVNVGVGACNAQQARNNNGWTRITCNNATTGPTYVAPGTCVPGTDANGVTTTCDDVNTGPTAVASCTPGTDATTKKVTSCNTNTTAPTQQAIGTTCTDIAPSGSNFYVKKTCNSVDVSTTVPAGTCAPSPLGVQPVVSCSTVTTPPVAVGSCAAGTDAGNITTVCTPEVVGPEKVASCTAVQPSGSNGFQTVSCAPIQGVKVQTKTRTITTTSMVSGSEVIEGTGVSQTPVDTNWTDVGGICYVAPQSPPLIDTSTDWKQSTAGMPNGCTGWPCLGTVDTSKAIAGSINSLADVAQYYYVTDLRPNPTNPDVSKNDVPKLGSGAEDDRAPWQHMTTFVLGLGVSGKLEFRPDYKSALSGDYSKIRSYENTPALNWPVWPTSANLGPLAYNDPKSIDDYWHTAVNGRGKFFSAKDPDSVVQGLRDALAGIDAQAGAGAGAATSNLAPISGDNFVYSGSFTSSEWTGDLQAQEIDLANKTVSTSIKWSARTALDLATGLECDNRTIFTRNPANGAKIDFSWNSYACGSDGNRSGSAKSGLTTALQSYFSDANVLGGPAGWSQYPLMTDGSAGTVDQRTASRGANLVNFLRGQRGLEGFATNKIDKLYRSRTHVLGDIVHSQAAYVRAPSLNYQDPGYANFKTTNADRTPMVYVGANDGMLHAFYAPQKATDPNYLKAGQEAWAYVPTPTMSKLWKLADANYADKHIFTVDGSPVTGDVRGSATDSWRSILVGGFGAGGSGYYALDITNPAAPTPMWEFSEGACASNPVGATADCNMGLSFGRPIITKLTNGKWVVIVNSGYNNVTASGSDGRGYLFVLDAITGQMISRISTGVGSTGTPSNLAELNFFVNNMAYDNTAQRVYGGDMLGNIWRFDINDIIAPAGREATLLGTARDSGGKAQPITTRVELAEVSGSTMVLVGTGRLLASVDLVDTSAQTVYGIKDGLSATSPVYSNLRTALKPLRLTQTGTGASATRTVACAAATVGDCSSANGWYIDLPDSGERVNVEMQSLLGTLVFATNVPSDTLCAIGGSSWLNYVNLINGEPVATSPDGVASVPYYTNSIVVGRGAVRIGDGYYDLGVGSEDVKVLKRFHVGSPPPQGKRISWREIVQ
ncbi:Tfp pilus tip-associated adhesin PilY1 [Burkholderiales bacterium 8X]|nr:Tfp pilus tip-associated adhesin PilY1 [Burkholderiales bacterium 8X]